VYAAIGKVDIVASGLAEADHRIEGALPACMTPDRARGGMIEFDDAKKAGVPVSLDRMQGKFGMVTVTFDVGEDVKLVPAVDDRACQPIAVRLGTASTGLSEPSFQKRKPHALSCSKRWRPLSPSRIFRQLRRETV